LHTYRTHTCAALRPEHVGQTIRISGWVHSVRDHGGLLFIDLRDTYGMTQCVLPGGHKQFAEISNWRVESVITIDGKVVARNDATKNDRLPTGHIEVVIDTSTMQGAAKVLPLQVASEEDAGEDVRLKYRYLDLRRDKMQKKIKLRSKVVSSLRKRMTENGFNEFQTPILTASSPEGARDFLVPSRVHPGKFYALPQAPQQFKQLLMMSGFDRYFQIAPCFRDEDGRADRLAEIDQLDVERSFVTQEDVFATMEPVIGGLFEEVGSINAPHTVTNWREGGWPHIKYNDAMLKYGSDKPDLRNPLVICDVTSVFARADVEFKAFKGIIEQGGVVRAIRAPKVGAQPRSFFDKLNGWAQEQGAKGLGYILIEAGEGKGPIAKFVPPAATEELKKIAGLEDGDAVFFVCDKEGPAAKFASKARDKICDDMGVRETGTYKSAGLSTSRNTNAMKKPARSNSPTTRSPCRRAACRRWKTKTRWISMPTSMIASAMATNCAPARSVTTNRKSWNAYSRLRATARTCLRRNSAACSRPSVTAPRRTAAVPSVSTVSS